jgi:hypothetical protein
MMSVKGMPLSTRMVQKYRAEQKDMTRRIIGIPNEAEPSRNAGGEVIFSSDNTVFFEWQGEPNINHNVKPRYLPGDLIYVRESWRIGAWDWSTGRFALDYRDEVRREWVQVADTERAERYIIQTYQDAAKAGLVDPKILEDTGLWATWPPVGWEAGKGPARWRPPRFMPREFAREFGIVKAVKVERVQEISEDDAVREGFHSGRCNPKRCDPCVYGSACPGWSSVEEFAYLWQALNAKRNPTYSWNANPWIWAYTIERIPMPEGWPNV